MWKKISEQRWKEIERDATRRNMKLYITKEFAWELFIKQNKKCALTGRKITMPKSHKIRGTASLDRIDSNVGYVEDNLQWVHKDINRMKNKYSNKEFIELCCKVANHNK